MRLHTSGTAFSRIIAVAIAGFFSIFFATTDKAQTCRVHQGFATDGCETMKEVFEYDYVDEKPEFPGGQEAFLSYINHHRKYPKEAYDRGVEGRVTCSFIVNPDGNISHIKVLRGGDRSLNIEAMRVLTEMPKWNPGSHKGQYVPVRVVHSIPFRR